MSIENRKAEHIETCLNEKIIPGYSYWDDIKLVHDALPEINADDIDMSITLFGRKLDFPLIVTAITGGFEGAEKINGNIAEACADLGIGMGVGSERAGIMGVEPKSYTIVKEYDVPLMIGNVGAPQLVPQHSKDFIGADEIEKAIDLVDADVMAIHLNYLQEAIQPGGDVNAEGCHEAIRELAHKYPLIIKETGAGISRDVSRRLKGIGILGIDIAGMGGTSFSAVEMYRAQEIKDEVLATMGKTFFEWGIPAPVSLRDAKCGLPLIASGGLLNGVHVANSIAMGASCAGVAYAVLKEAMVSADAVKKKLNIIKEELKIAMLLTGCSDIKQLSSARHVILGKTAQWLEGLE